MPSILVCSCEHKIANPDRHRASNDRKALAGIEKLQGQLVKMRWLVERRKKREHVLLMEDACREILIMQYAEGRLYDTGTGRYVMLKDIARMRDMGWLVVIREASSGEDITGAVLDRRK